MKALVNNKTGPEVLEAAILKYETGKISTDIFINTVLSQCGPKVQALDVIEAWNSMLIGIPEYRLAMLKMLKPNYNLYLLSNTNEMHIEWINRYLSKRFGVMDFPKEYWDNVYYSYLLHDRKPNASIFQHIIGDAYLTPSLTLFLDDVVENLEAADQMGFGTYLVTDKVDIAEFLKVEGFY